MCLEIEKTVVRNSRASSSSNHGPPVAGRSTTNTHTSAARVLLVFGPDHPALKRLRLISSQLED